jgi:type II secretory pathway pseudopilin PulG
MTSLLEALLVLAIVATLSGVALVSAMDHVEAARYSRAQADTESLGVAIHSFINDNGFAPGYKSGVQRGADAAIFLLLETQGSDPGEMTSLDWPSEESDRDRLENHLIRNLPSGAGPRYLRMGEISYARHKGWNGPYIAKAPSSDPWDNKYLVNVQFLTPRGLKMPAGNMQLGIGQRPAAIVISAGPNRRLETAFAQPADSFAAGGDDIVFRIQ